MTVDRRILFENIVAKIEKLTAEVGEEAPCSLALAILVNDADDDAQGMFSHLRHYVQSSYHGAALLATLARAIAMTAAENDDRDSAASFLAFAQAIEEEFDLTIPTTQ